MTAAFGHSKAVMRDQRPRLFIQMRDHADIVEIGAQQIVQGAQFLGPRQQVAQLRRAQHHMIGAGLGQLMRDQRVKFIAQGGADQGAVQAAAVA